MQLLCRLINVHFNWDHKIFLLILLASIVVIHTADGQRSCYQCEGINCLRSTYNKVEKCTNGLDICATVFDGQTVQAQGCLENLAEDLRLKCESDDVDALRECHKCNDNLCNNKAASTFECVQCDSNTDSNCSNNADSLQATRCPISRTPNQYCYAQKDGNRVVRGCSSTVEQQRSCLSSQECIICEPSEISGCNIQRATDEVNPNPGPNPTASTSTTARPATSAPNPGENGSGSVSSFGLTNYAVLLVACILKFY